MNQTLLQPDRLVKHSGKLKTILIFLLLIAIGTGSYAQQRERPMPKTFKDKLWYGGSFGLGLSGGQNSSQFNIGIFPMVGYKIIPWFSVGPRLGFDYNYYKGPATNGKIASTNIFSFYGGVFARAKIYMGFFAQTEYGVDMGRLPSIDSYGRLFVENDKVTKTQVTQESGLLGVGYNSGGEFASEILVLYNVLLPDDSYNNPFNFRIGFTYKF